jgi:glycosyltransferase involved in cell wall biosynthesis
MRLTIVSPFPPEISGIGQYGWHLAERLAAHENFEPVTVLTGRNPQFPAAFAPNGITTHYVWERDALGSLGQLRVWLNTLPTDVLWLNLGFTMFGASRWMNAAGLLTVLWLRQQRVPLVVTLHETFEAAALPTLGITHGAVTQWGGEWVTRRLLQAEAVCVPLRDHWQKLRRYPARQLLYVPHGLFYEPCHLPHPRHAPPAEILFFASYAPSRGLEVLLAAFAQVKRALPHATLTLAGSDHPRFPGYRAALQAQHAGVAHWLGAQTEAELLARFAEACVVVLPYLATTGPSSVMLRAAAHGRPIIASDLPPLRHTATENNLQVLFVPSNCADALADALLQLLRDPAQQQAQAAHNLAAVQPIAPRHISRRYAEIFRQVACAT